MSNRYKSDDDLSLQDVQMLMSELSKAIEDLAPALATVLYNYPGIKEFFEFQFLDVKDRAFTIEIRKESNTNKDLVLSPDPNERADLPHEKDRH